MILLKSPICKRNDPGMGDIASAKTLQHQNTAHLETIFIHTINDKLRTIFFYFSFDYNPTKKIIYSILKTIEY